MADMSKAPFPWHSRPSGISWVDKFSTAQAMEQCNEWNLTPADTLEANRALLKNYNKSPSQKASDRATTEVSPSLHTETDILEQDNTVSQKDNHSPLPARSSTVELQNYGTYRRYDRRLDDSYSKHSSRGR
uniref:Uncharacterized protein n=1 Tax=Cuerna arida TaxID=1464854 RepID=A0A1B6GLU3_9HEMI